MCWDCETVGTVKQFRYKYAQRMETMKQSGLWSSLGTHGSVVVIWWLCISSSGETRKFDFLNQIWHWRSRSIATQIYRDLNQAIFHLWSKFGDPSLNGLNELWCGQAQNRVNSDFKLNLILMVKVNWLLKQLGPLPRSFASLFQIWPS